MNDWNPEALLDLAIKLYGAPAVRKDPRKRLADAAVILVESKAVCDSGLSAELFVHALAHDEARAASTPDTSVPWNDVRKMKAFTYARAEDFKKLVTRFLTDFYSTGEPIPAGEDPATWRSRMVRERVALWQSAGKDGGIPAGMLETLKAFKQHGKKYRKHLLQSHVSAVRGSDKL